MLILVMVVVLLFQVNHNGVLQLLDVQVLQQVQVCQVCKLHVPLDTIGKLMVLMLQLREINMEYMTWLVEHGNA